MHTSLWKEAFGCDFDIDVAHQGMSIGVQNGTLENYVLILKLKLHSQQHKGRNLEKICERN